MCVVIECMGLNSIQIIMPDLPVAEYRGSLPDPQSQRKGRWVQEPTLPLLIRTGLSALSWNSGMRANYYSSKVILSMRARVAPTQRCTPSPMVEWFMGGNRRSKGTVSGPSKPSSTQLRTLVWHSLIGVPAQRSQNRAFLNTSTRVCWAFGCLTAAVRSPARPDESGLVFGRDSKLRP